MGRHGQGLITYQEFIAVLDNAEQNDELKLKTESSAALNDSLVFFDSSDLVLQAAPNSSEKPQGPAADDRYNEYLKIIQSDAKRLAQHLKSNFNETEGDKAISDAGNIVDHILDTNS